MLQKRKIVCIGVFFGTIVLILLGLFLSKKKTLSEIDFDSVYLSMHENDSIDAEFIKSYRGTNTYVVEEKLENLEEFASHFDRIFTSGNDVIQMFLAVDPREISISQIQKFLIPYVEKNGGTNFDILLTSFPLDYWTAQGLDLTKEQFSHYIDFVSVLTPYENVKCFFPGTEYWLCVNTNHFAETGYGLSKEMVRKIFLYTSCDGVFQVKGQQFEEQMEAFLQLISEEIQNPTHFPELGDLHVIMFGDSILEYGESSNTVAGFVEGLSHALCTNLAVGGTASEDFPKKVQEFCDSVSNEALSEREKVFVINYGLNDYFSGNTLEVYKENLTRGVKLLQKNYPKARILFMAPTYAVKEDAPIELPDYVKTAVTTAESLHVECINNYDDWILNANTVGIYTTDGTHLNEFGRLKLAQRIMEYLEK